jgi:hypothetical protein
LAYLVQVLLPRYAQDGTPFPDTQYAAIRRELTEEFGGVTAYMRSPAAGLWKRDDGTIDRDEMLMVEVMADDLDRDWWDRYRRDLESRFNQDAIVARAIAIEPL